MTSKESLFNKGIFKTVLRRFRLGSILYFFSLFLSVPTAFLTRSPERLLSRYIDIYGNTLPAQSSPLLDTNFLVLPVLITMVVPSVVMLLVFNFVHNFRHTVFTHSLPITRKSNYFSTLFGAFCLMAFPVLCNTFILLVMHFCGWGAILGILPICIWALALLSILFIMFSVSCFAAFLTGNAFAALGLNLILQLLPLAASAAVLLFGNQYVYGFYDGNAIFEDMIQASPMIYLFSSVINKNAYFFFTKAGVWIFLLVAIVLYTGAYFLYKKRRMELCGDVAAFSRMNPILKYAVCTIAFVLSFGIFSTLEMHAFAYYILTALVTAIVYFACEMVLKKNLRVLKYYKGLLALFAVLTLCVSFVAFTSVFGFETRVPDVEKIESVAVYTGYINEKPYVDDASLIQKATQFHKELLKDIPVTEKEETGSVTVRPMETAVSKPVSSSYEMLFFNYKLANGKEMTRRYKIDTETSYRIFSSLFENTAYKLKTTRIDTILEENLKSVTIDTSCGHSNYALTINEDAPELMRAIKQDIIENGYDDFYASYSLNMYIGVDLSYEENQIAKIFKEEDDNSNKYYHFGISVHPSFKHTFAFLNENGYLQTLKNYYANHFYVSKVPVLYEELNFTYQGKSYMPHETIVIPMAELQKLSVNAGAQVFESYLLTQTPAPSSPYRENYYMFLIDSDLKREGVPAGSHLIRFSAENFPINLLEM